ncbi:peroxin-26 Pex26-Penicillium chrysogenum [Mactra antiquata]
MAAVEIPKPNFGCKSKFLHELNACVEKASDCLLLKDFKGCEVTSKYGINRAKLFMEEEKACQCMESLCILCIQAMAELNRWQEVLPFIQEVFTGIELCPAIVIQICLLLLTKVKEYTQCHAIASLWLKCEDNSYKVGYDRVACLYIAHVMLPRGQLPLVQQFLNSCTHLTEQVKNNICYKSEELVKSMSVENEDKKVVNDYDNNTYTDTEDCSHLDNEDIEDGDSITKYIKSICSIVVYGDALFTVVYGDALFSIVNGVALFTIVYGDALFSIVYGDALFSIVYGDALFSIVYGDALFSIVYVDALFSVVYGDALFSIVYGDALFSVVYGDA